MVNDDFLLIIDNGLYFYLECNSLNSPRCDFPKQYQTEAHIRMRGSTINPKIEQMYFDQ